MQGVTSEGTMTSAVLLHQGLFSFVVCHMDKLSKLNCSKGMVEICPGVQVLYDVINMNSVSLCVIL